MEQWVNPRTGGTADICKVVLDKRRAPWWTVSLMCVSTSNSHCGGRSKKRACARGRGSEVSGKKEWAVDGGWAHSSLSLKAHHLPGRNHQGARDTELGISSPIELGSNSTTSSRCMQKSNRNHRNGKAMLQDSGLHHEAAKNTNF